MPTPKIIRRLGQTTDQIFPVINPSACINKTKPIMTIAIPISILVNLKSINDLLTIFIIPGKENNKSIKGEDI